MLQPGVIQTFPKAPSARWDNLHGCEAAGGAGVQEARLGAGREFSACSLVPFLLRCRISFASFSVTPAGATTSSFRGVITCGARNICLQVGRWERREPDLPAVPVTDSLASSLCPGHALPALQVPR